MTAQSLHDIILKGIRDTVKSLQPEAELILFGSQARGDFVLDSDWDIIIITDHALSSPEDDILRKSLYEYELEKDIVLSVMIRSRDQWLNPIFRITPFYNNVIREGITLQ
jgi:uncharacterized protein